MLKIGVLGTGHLGKIHLKCIKQSDVYELVGFYDPNQETAEKVAKEYELKAFSSLEELMDAVEVIDIVTPTITHYELAVKAIQAGKHIFIEKPLTHTVEQAEHLMELQKHYNVKVQVGHVERFNPALLSLGEMELQPMFVEGHRLAMFNPRGTDVSVVLDLMIHDLDILLSIVQSKVKTLHSSGVAVVSNTPDISNVRIEFENGCVANLTASRISMKQMRKMRLFQKDAYISLDFLDKKAQIIRLHDTPPEHTSNTMEIPTPKGTKILEISSPEAMPVNAIQMELETFAECIVNDTTPKVSIEDGYEALQLAHQIMSSTPESFRDSLSENPIMS